MPQFDETFDWVVIGSGAGSMSSALMMRKAGKSVVILEKGQWVGGTTCKSGGVMWIPNNPFMDPGEDSTEKGITYLDAVVGDPADAPGTSHERRLTYVVEAPKMVNFLLGEGVKLERGSHYWPDYYDELPGGCKTSRTVTAVPFNKRELGEWEPKLRKGFIEAPAKLDDGMKFPFMKHSWKIKWSFAKVAARVVAAKLTGKHWTTAGAALQGRMLKAALAAGTDIRTESPVKHVIIENGRAVGVEVEQDGTLRRIGARLGVLNNGGGFSQNQPMRDKYQPGTRVEWSNGIETDMGDMHWEMERIGATLAQMDEFVGFPGTCPPGWDQGYVKPGMQGTTAKPHCILVDQTGKRYFDEACSYELYCETMIKHQGGVPSWAIFDEQLISEYGVGGIKVTPKVKAQWLESGYLKMADAVEGLAALTSIDPATLKATVDRWNGFVDRGKDEDFNRGQRAYGDWLGDPFYPGDSKCRGRIDKGPFYAVEVIPGDVGTYGGVVTDSSARVLDANGKPIEGLYACGIATASAMGRVYPGAGASVGPSMVYGWIAAKHAAGLDNQAL